MTIVNKDYLSEQASVSPETVQPFPKFAQGLRDRQPPRHPRAHARNHGVRHPLQRGR